MNIGTACMALHGDGVLWPNSRALGDTGGFLFGQDGMDSSMYEASVTDLGNGGKKRIAGVTRNSVGTALPSCIVKGYLTATDAFVSQCTSQGDGAFDFCTQFTGAHYLVAYLAGSPDVAGTTVNTLTPI